MTLLFCFIGFTSGFGQITQYWQEFTSYEGQFRVKGPGDFIHKEDTVATGMGNIVYHTYFHQADPQKDENVIYMISYCEYPEYGMHSDSTELMEEFFETTIDAAAFSIKGEVRYIDPIDWLGWSGRLWRIDYRDGNAVVKTKAILVENRYYAVQVISTKNNHINISSDQFFDSFRLFEG